MLEGLTQPIIDLHGIRPEAVTGLLDMAPLTLFLPMIVALVISLALIPLMVRLAPYTGMLDQPDPRKVHVVPVPRVGGFGIVIGALTPVLLLLPLDTLLQSYLFGAGVLFLFGVLDDSRELGHYTKFVGQLIAVSVVVYYGDLYVTHLPFMGDEPVPAPLGRLFTVMAMVGMINAINHSDGLDGLAGGESLLSLAGMIYLSYLANGAQFILIALATVGGLLGFLRYNTHPARIFMGDGGSQFLGFTLAFLAVDLTQRVNPLLSPALPALLLGLPIADIIAVLLQRIYQGMNWFRATRNHIHHRLLDIGFRHHESVVIIYSIQALLVICGVLMPYESDAFIAGLYLGVVAVVFALLFTAYRNGWRVRSRHSAAQTHSPVGRLAQARWAGLLVFHTVQLCMTVILVGGALVAQAVPPDIELMALALTALLLVRLLPFRTLRLIPLRPLVYLGIVLVVYLTNRFQPEFLAGADPWTYTLYGLLVAAIAGCIRLSDAGEFRVTPMDFLLILAAILITLLSGAGMIQATEVSIVLKSIIMFYGAELVLGKMNTRRNLFTAALLLALVIVSVRGTGLLF